MLYLLILTDTEKSDDEYSEDFYIGFYETAAQAAEVAEYYLNNVTGFCDFPCTYRIIPKKVAGEFKNKSSNQIFFIQGYDLNENLDEINIIEDQCYITQAQAEAELELLKNKYKRTEWTISCWTIGQNEWQEGFCRI